MVGFVHPLRLFRVVKLNGVDRGLCMVERRCKTFLFVKYLCLFFWYSLSSVFFVFTILFQEEDS